MDKKKDNKEVNLAPAARHAKRHDTDQWRPRGLRDWTLFIIAVAAPIFIITFWFISLMTDKF